MGLIFLLPFVFVIGIGLIGYGLWCLVRGHAALAEATIRGGPARLLGASAILCGSVCFLLFGAFFKAHWPILSCWRWIAASGLLGAAMALAWAGWQQRERTLLTYGVLTLMLGSFIAVPSTTLAAVIYRFTGDRRFKAPDYGR